MQEIDSGDANAQAVPRLLEKLSAPGRVPSYYSGGLELLTQALAGCEWPHSKALPPPLIPPTFTLPHSSFSFLSRNLFFFPLLSPLHWFTYFTALWLNGPSGAKG